MENKISIGNWILFFLTSWGLSFTVYLILQIGAILNLQGKMRNFVMLPLPIMALIIIVTIVGYQQQSNLWPIYLIFVSPLAVLFVGTVWAIGFFVTRRKK